VTGINWFVFYLDGATGQAHACDRYACVASPCLCGAYTTSRTSTVPLAPQRRRRCSCRAHELTARTWIQRELSGIAVRWRRLQVKERWRVYLLNQAGEFVGTSASAVCTRGMPRPFQSTSVRRIQCPRISEYLILFFRVSSSGRGKEGGRRGGGSRCARRLFGTHARILACACTPDTYTVSWAHTCTYTHVYVFTGRITLM